MNTNLSSKFSLSKPLLPISKSLQNSTDELGLVLQESSQLLSISQRDEQRFNAFVAKKQTNIEQSKL